ncbi:MAG: 4-hydroxybenzoyl-CoA thioesterase [Acidobacteriota bacterium]|nr:4-hydroxybenzoyl-CoA thioesterase [Acidobacteriota bacterium]
MSFSARIIVRFADADAAGLVYYPVVFHYFHVAMEEFFAARCGTTYARLMHDQRIGFPTVNVKAEFFVPILYGDEIDVEVFVSRVGTSSATFEYAARRASDNLICARSTQVQVSMNLDTRRPVSIPDVLRRAFDESVD